jgi:katanin p60 ATPase-containing subunit A1
MARFYAPTTIFIDEIDSLCGKRGGGSEDTGRKMKAEILIQIDGANSPNLETDLDENGNQKSGSKLVSVIAATNNPWDLDDAIIRRLEKRIHIPMPNDIARSQLFELKLKGTQVGELDYKRLVINTEGYSGSDIENV